MKGTTPQASAQAIAVAPDPLTWLSVPQLDRHTIDSLRKTLPLGALPYIYNQFIQLTTDRFVALRRGEVQPEALAHDAHSVVGSAGMLGAARLEAACRAVPAQLEAGVPAADLAQQLSDVFTELCQAIHQEGLSA